MESKKIEFIKSVDLGSPKGVFKGAYLKGKSPIVTLEGVEQSFVSQKSIVSFVSSVSSGLRNDVLDTTLLAQLAANKKFPNQGDSFDWYNAFIDTLIKLGWIIENSDFSTFESNATALEVKDAIIEILTAAFGANIVPIVLKTLQAIGKLSDKDGTIIAFKKNSQTQKKGCFQIALAVEENGTVTMKMGTFFITSKDDITQILFFKFSKANTKLKYNSKQASLSTSAYTQKVRDAVINKLGNAIEENIAEIQI